jgi:ATP phosphoribosyltransferase regulatory subunit
MSTEDRWLLPEGVEEALPGQARRLEVLRRRLLDLYAGWGYDLVMPPFIEYLDSLLPGAGRDLDLRTFKLIDQLTGRSMGVRADMTPQVARIDAHCMQGPGPNRLCYIGTVLHTRPEALGGTRSPLQVGAELYGHAGSDSDLEIMRLMLATLRACHVPSGYMDLGHVGIFRGLAEDAGLDAAQEAELFDMLQRKAEPEIDAFVSALQVDADTAGRLQALAGLNGDREVLARARTALAGAPAGVHEALAQLEALATALGRLEPDLEVHFDLAELRGYRYHAGVVFAAYVPGQGQEVARGGRYDAIGRYFGRARPATGFSTDLKALLGLSQDADVASPSGIYAPLDPDIALTQAIERLRASGERVVCALEGDGATPADLGCDRRLVARDGDWQVEVLQ